jgi:diaminopimelate decarboxylase
MKRKTRVVIVGGGIIGCSVAYHLAKEGIGDVVLLDMMPSLGSGETRWSVAMLMHQTENALLTRMAQESIKEYAEYKRAGAKFDFHQVGSVLYTTQPANAFKIRARVKMQMELGVESYELSPDQIKNLVPFANVDDIVLGSYCPFDGYISNHQAVVEWFRSEAIKQGVEFYTDTQVKDILVENGQVRGVVTSDGSTIETDYLVNAAGRMGHLIAKLTGITIPMNGDKRNVFRLRPSRPIEPFPIFEDIDEESKWYFRPDGPNIIFGMGPTMPVVTDQFERVLNRAPVDAWAMDALKDFVERRVESFTYEVGGEEDSWSAVRSLIPDDLPILGPVDNVRGLINCCGLSGFGITTGPISGRLIAELIANKQNTTIALTPFHLSRFQYRSWCSKSNELMLGPRSVRSLAEEFGTPLYLYDGEIALNRLALIRAAFPGFEVLYSLKANPNQGLAKVLAEANVGAELASIRELDVALSAGYVPGQITLGGPGKLRSEMEEAVLQGVGIIDIESERELEELEAIGRHFQKSISATLRINTQFSLKTRPGERMAGTASQYGMDEENIFEILARSNLKYVKIEGLHVHIASQVLDSTDLLGHYTYTANLAKRLSTDPKFDLKVINFGGGIGIPYSTHDEPIDLFTLGSEARRSLSAIFPNPRLRPRFQFELGRFLIASSGIFLATVVEIKPSRETIFVITDGGINAFSRPAMPWAQQHSCSIASKQGEKPTGRYKVVGRSCLPADVLCESVELPGPEEGDTLVIHDAGAYGFSMSMLLWASQVPPREILYVGNEFKLDDSHRLTKTLALRPFEELVISG